MNETWLIMGLTFSNTQGKTVRDGKVTIASQKSSGNQTMQLQMKGTIMVLPWSHSLGSY